MAMIGKYDLVLEKPSVNAAGFLGFAPDPQAEIEWTMLGAFITNPISLRPRTPATPPRLVPFPGGFLIHTGHPNPGLRGVLKRHRARWERSPLPIIPHLLAEDPDSLRECLQILEQVEGVMGVEIGPPPGVDSIGLKDLAGAAQGELPFILQLPLGEAARLAPIAEAGGAAAVSLGPPRGAVSGPEGEVITGRMYGPAIYPLVLGALAGITRLGIPIIAGGGVSSLENASALRGAGAAAVCFDYVLWTPGGFWIPGQG